MSMNVPVCRTHEMVLEYAKLAAKYNIPVMGVKGPSMCFFLNGFDMARSVIPDSMHNLWLGISVQFRKLWEKSVGKPYYVRNLYSQIDSYLVSTKPSLDLLRVPRILEQYSSDWKASENRDFVLYLSPVILKFVLQKQYYDHWMLFVCGCRLLYRTEVPYEDTRIALRLFHKFILLTADLYGEENVTYNLHLLQHLPQSVRDWGAPWATSAFLFESAGGDLIQLFHGTRYIPQQMFSGFLAKRKLRTYAKRYMADAEESVRELYGKLDHSFNFSSHSGLQFFGKSQEFLLTGQFADCVNSSLRGVSEGELCCICDTVVSYEKMSVNGKIYCTERYASKFQRDNSLVRHFNASMYRIQEIVVISHVPSCSFAELGESSLLIGKCVALLRLPPNIDDHANYDLASCIFKVDRRKRANLHFAFRPEEISNRAIVINNGNDSYVVDCNLRTEND